jgi:hypothetical protein
MYSRIRYHVGLREDSFVLFQTEPKRGGIRHGQRVPIVRVYRLAKESKNENAAAQTSGGNAYNCQTYIWNYWKRLPIGKHNTAVDNARGFRGQLISPVEGGARYYDGLRGVSRYVFKVTVYNRPVVFAVFLGPIVPLPLCLDSHTFIDPMVIFNRVLFPFFAFVGGDDRVKV